MKKRRELDALIENRTRRENTGCENGRAEFDSLSSLSSPGADTYVAPAGTYLNISSKRTSRGSGSGCTCTLRRMIRICLPACFLSLVAACITACIGIVWMQVQLKTDVERLKDRLIKLETWQQDQPSAMDDVKKALSIMESGIHEVKDGENGVRNIAEKLAVLTQRFDDQDVIPKDGFKLVQQEVSEMKQTIDNLKLSVESMKSTIEGVRTAQQLLTTSYDKLQTDVQAFKKEANADMNVEQLTDLVSSSKQEAESGIMQMNSTLQRISADLIGVEHKVDDVQLKVTSDEIWKTISPRITDLKQDIVSLRQFKESENSTVALAKRVSDLQKRMSDLLSLVKVKEMGAEEPEAKISSIEKTLPQLSTEELVKVLRNEFNGIDKDKNERLSKLELEDKFGKGIFEKMSGYDLNLDEELSRDEVFAGVTKAPVAADRPKQKRRARSRLRN